MRIRNKDIFISLGYDEYLVCKFIDKKCYTTNKYKKYYLFNISIYYYNKSGEFIHRLYGI